MFILTLTYVLVDNFCPCLIYEPFRQKDEICGFLMGSSTIYNTYLAKNVAQIILGLGFAALDLYYVIMARDEVGYCDIPLGKSFKVELQII